MAELVRHKKGRHRSWPYRLRYCRDGLIYTITFTDSCRYEHGDLDQYDWNKLFGLKKYPYTRWTSQMWAWRYVDGRFDVGMYRHYRGSTILPSSWSSISVGQELMLVMAGRGWLINPWFGGQKCAPHDMKILVDFL